MKEDNIYVKEWIGYEDIEHYEESVGLMGGFFTDGMRWKDYLDNISDKYYPHLEAIRKSVVENNIKETGTFHQYSDCGVPLFSDGTIATFSFRGWGDLLAAIWSEEEDKDYCYMDYYC